MNSTRTPLLLALLSAPTVSTAQVCGQHDEGPAQLVPQCAPPAATLLRGDDQRAPYGCGEARVLFVDVPTWMPAPSEYPTSGVGGHLSDRLVAEVGYQIDTDWFCPEGACGEACRDDLANAGVDAEVDAVLPRRPANGLRGDGHLRFWRLRFVRGGGGYLALDPWAHCEALDRVRTAVTGLLTDYGVHPADVDEVRVGREACSVKPMATPTDWHAERIGTKAPPAPFGVNWADRPHLALVDTGLEPALEAALDVQARDYVGQVPEPSDPATHHHGAAMADLVRQVAPPAAARVSAFRVMDGGGVGVVGHVARAVDSAVHDDADPLVVNLSLGWLPEYERRRTVYGDACQTREDGVGEALRYVLATAREADDRQRPVLVVSAAGNRPLSGEKPEFHDVQTQAPYDACTTGWWDVGRPAMLMPAEWSRTVPCTGNDPLTLAVGAVDNRDLPTAVSIPEAETEPALVAPGEHVYAASGASGGASPMFTGTSVASALTAASAARALARLVERWSADPWLTRIAGKHIPALLYLTGVDVGRQTHGWVPVRRLHAGRLDQLLSCGDLDAVLSCVDWVADFGHQALLTDCGGLLELCGIGAVAADPDEPDGDTPGGAGGAPICGASTPGTSDEACGHWLDCVDNTMEVFFGPAAASGNADRAPRSELAGVGPQPTDPMCPDCQLEQVGAKWAVHARFNSKMPGNTQIENPYLLLTLNKAGTSKRYIPLAAPNDAKYFAPGQKVAFTGLSLPSFVKAQLLVTVEQSGKFKAWDVSPLWTKW